MFRRHRRHVALVALLALLGVGIGGADADVDRSSDVLPFGAPALGSSSDLTAVTAPVVAIAATTAGGGYLEVTSDGAVLPFGTASFAGDASGLPLAAPVVAVAVDPDGDGYWLAAADGGVFAFDAAFVGSAGGLALRAPIVGIAAHGAGGYWLVAADGGVFAFGDAPFLGAATDAGAAAVGIVATGDGAGYAIALRDGRVVGFGDATSGAPGVELAAPAVGVAVDPDGEGYWLAAADGGVFAIDAEFRGSAGGIPLGDRPVVGIAADPASGGYWLARRGRPSSAAPCLDQVHPSASATDGMSVTAFATDHGTSPSRMSGAVAGRIDDGIAPGIDLLLVTLDSAALRAAGGIWYGMSGTPVYAPDGRLLGAVSYVMSWGPSRYAGVTPADAMVTGLAPKELPATVKITGPLAAELGTAGTLVPLAHPVLVSGVDDRGVERLASALADAGFDARAVRRGPAAPMSAASSSALRPGSPVAMAVSFGDSTIASVGTVTMVCGQQVYAFGHPWSNMGAVTATAQLADVQYIQPDDAGGAYTIANLGGTIGTVRDDRLVGVGIELGAAPAATRVTSQVMDTATGRTRRGTSMAHDLQGTLPWAVANHLYMNLVGVPLAEGPETIDVRWTATLHAGDRDVTFTRSNRFSERSWAASSAEGEIAMLLDALVSSNPFAEVTAADVDMVASVSPGYATARVGELFVDEGGAWRTVDPFETLGLQPGQSVRLRVELLPFGGGAASFEELTVDVPLDAGGMYGVLAVTGGTGDRWIDPLSASSFDELLEELGTLPRNDDVTAALDVDGLATVTATARASSVVTGGVYVSVEVVGGEPAAG